MAKIGRFKNEQVRDAYLAAYADLEALSSVPATTLDIQTSFGTTHVRRCGSGAGTPIVLLHSFGGNGLYWDFVIEDLSTDRVVFALDTIGTAGKSVQTAPIGKEADFAAWFDEVMAGLDVDRAHVMGLSQGAWHGALVTVHAPQRVASLILVEPNGVITKMKWSVLFKIMRFGMSSSDENWKKMTAWLTPGVTMSDTAFACARAALGYRTRLGWARVLKDAELRSITVSMLAIFGGESVVCDPVQADERITALVPNAEIEIYPGMGHGVLDQISERVVSRILNFVQQHDQKAASTTR
ncbi:alpha/beta fold hydrolase [Nocardia sp. CNY236]|uniref:alpha/beta fold hydrolase n=1 Tax=Nocardia sp. CNY236 TaxID=1169152 RepID=UPI0003F978A8|nr:alpha/beta fold hydrolase [Nocardia sp. CNY236]